MGPLARRAPARLFRSGVWGFLVTGAFVLLAGAASSVPLFAEAAGNAALSEQLSGVASNASAADAPVVRIVGGEGTRGESKLHDGLNGIPGLGEPAVTAASVGVESRSILERFSPFVSAAGSTRTGRARLYGDDDLIHALVPAEGSQLPSSSTTKGAGSAAQQGVWLPKPLARSLQVGTGDRIQVGVRFLDEGTNTSAFTRVAGVYEVGPDTVLPADQPGSMRWVRRRDDAPVDSEFRTLPSYLMLTDVASATKLAEAIGDDLLYAVEGQLVPSRPTLAQAQATVAGILQRQVEVRDPSQVGGSPGVLREQVVSGMPTIVGAARAVADRTVAWTLTAGAAGLVLGLLAVLAVAVFGLLQRAVEVRHATSLGIRASAIGVMAAVEVLPVALVCSGVGLVISWRLMVTAGPAGAITEAGLREAAWHAVLAVGAGTVLVAVAATLAAVLAGRLVAPSRAPRTMPWELAVVTVAVTAAIGVLVRPADGSPPSPLDLLVPVLVLAAIGAVGGRGLLALAALAARRPAAGKAWSRRPAAALALRRLAAGGQQAVLLIVLLTVGFGFLFYSLSAAASVRQVTADRTAVLAGAKATTEIAASWLIDPNAARAENAPKDSTAPVPGTRNPPLPADTTIVWRSRISVPPEYTTLDLLVIDPVTFAKVADWGTGPELAHARRLLAAMATADAAATAQLKAGRAPGPIPALGVGPVLQHRGDEAAVATVYRGDVPVRFVDAIPAFPGYGGNLPLVVVPADSFFSFLGPGDPRVRPLAKSGRFDTRSEFVPALWSSTNLAGLQGILDPLGLERRASTSYAQVAQGEPDIVAAANSTGYQIALGVCVGGLALLGLAMFADRAALRARAADLMLNRIGMGRSGIRRARAGELAMFALIGLVLAVVGVGLLIPFGARLLEPGGVHAPPFVLRLTPGAVALTALAVVIGWLLAVAVARSRATGGSGRAAGEVLRDAD